VQNDCTPQKLKTTTDLDEHLVEVTRIAEFPALSANAFRVVSAERSRQARIVS
jgi:hypothetical protein